MVKALLDVFFQRSIIGSIGYEVLVTRASGVVMICYSAFYDE